MNELDEATVDLRNNCYDSLGLEDEEELHLHVWDEIVLQIKDFSDLWMML